MRAGHTTFVQDKPWRHSSIRHCSTRTDSTDCATLHLWFGRPNETLDEFPECLEVDAAEDAMIQTPVHGSKREVRGLEVGESPPLHCTAA